MSQSPRRGPPLLTKAANQFAIHLFNTYLARHGDKYRNLLLCPYLIYHSLAMMLVGARDSTAQQLAKVLRLPESLLNVHGSNDAVHSPTVKSTLIRAGTIPRARSQSPGSSNNPSPRSASPKSPCSPPRSSHRGSTSSSQQPQQKITTMTPGQSPTPTLSPASSAASVIESPLSTLSPAANKQRVLDTSNRQRSDASKRTLTPDGNDEARHREFLMLSEQVLHGNHEFVHLASFIYLDKSAKRTERFKNILRDYYETKPKKIEFEKVDAMVKTVNEDVARTTENIYPEILSRQEAQKLEKSYMLLVNAVFFRGFWLSNFTDVKPGTFSKSTSQSPGKQEQPSPNKQFQVNMMSKLDYLAVVSDEHLNARIVKLPFEASDLQMLVILPNKTYDDLKEGLVEKMTEQRFTKVIEEFERCQPRAVRISIPIFCIDSGKISIQSTLMTMGASDLFDRERANFGGLCDNKPVWLHKILHRCFIICDNRGSITSSSFEKAKKRQAQLESGISTGHKSAAEEFVADHPFMYVIFDSITKTILLMGLYTDPSETLQVVHESSLPPEEAHQIYTEGVYKT